MNEVWRRQLQSELETLENHQQMRTLHVVGQGHDSWLIKQGRKLLNLASNNYLGLAGDERLVEAAIAAARRYGAGAAASRLITGNYALYQETEELLAAWKKTEKALLIGSGYTANLGVIAALAGRNSAVFSDRLNHASIVDGILLSKAEHRRYKHNDLDHLEKLLQNTDATKQKLIVTDTVFSMDGDTAYLEGLVQLKEKYGALLMVDEAHAGGIYGREGAGLAHENGLAEHVDVHMGTFSKALGCYGAYIAGNRLLIEYLTNKMRSLIFTTGLPPSTVGSIQQAIMIVKEDEARRSRLLDNGMMLRTALSEAGFDIGLSTTHIVPLIIGSNEATVRFSNRLQEEGIAAIAVRPPTVPDNSSRIRLTVTASHTIEEIQWAVDTIITAGRREGVIPG